MKFLLKILLVVGYSITLGQIPTSYSLNKSSLNKVAGDTPLSNSITQIVTVGDTIWLGTSKGLSVSYDNGENWRDFYQTEPFGNESAVSMGYYEGKIWVSTGHTIESNGEDINVGSGIKFSSDGGDSWISIPQSVDDPGDSSIVYGINNIRALPVTVEEQNINWDISFTPNKVWVASWAGGIRWNHIDSLEINPNRKWERVILPPDNLSSIKPSDTLNFSLQNASGKFGPEQYLNHLGFSVLGINDTLVYAGSAGGLNRSKDGGISWEKYTHQNQRNPINGNWIIDISAEDDGTVWATCWKAEGTSEFFGLSKSEDNCLSWESYLNGEKLYYHGIRKSDFGSEIFIPSDNGVYRSSNKGITWLQNPTIKDNLTNLKLLTSTFFAVDFSYLENDSYHIWLGSDNGLARLTQNESNDWTGTWKVYISSPEVSSESIAFPNPFSPDEAAIKLKYRFEGGAESVTVRIFDFGMNLVRTVLQNAARTGGNEYIESWDGRDENGEFAPNGVYFYRIDIGNDEPLFGKIIVLM